MEHGRMPGRRLVALLLVVLLNTGCAIWRPVAVGDRPFPARIRVETVSRERIEVEDPSVQGDSAIVGTEAKGREAVRVPLRDVTAIYGRFPNRPATVFLVSLTATVFAGGIFVLWVLRHPET